MPLYCPAAAQSPKAAPAKAVPATEDARLYAFLDREFAEELRQRPQLATRLGLKEGQDRLDDISEAATRRELEWRRASVARMKAQFDRAKLSADAQTNYDIWALELDRAELSYRFRQFSPPFYSFLYSAHSRLPGHSPSSSASPQSIHAPSLSSTSRMRAMPCRWSACRSVPSCTTSS